MQVIPLLRTMTLAVTISTVANAQRTDPSLLRAIRAIKAIDIHAHPPSLVAAGQRDTDFDALPCDPLEPTDPALSSRPDNPRFRAAREALFGYKSAPADPARLRELVAAKQRVKSAQGHILPAWVLDMLGIETELANRVSPGRGLTTPRGRGGPGGGARRF